MKNLQNEIDRAEILRRLRTVRADSQRLWGKMSANQMICHLSDGFRGATGEIEVAPIGNFLHRTIVKFLLLNLPRVKTIKNYPTMPEINQEIGGTKPIEFTADLAELERLIEHFVDERNDCSAWSHSLFGRMSRRQWSRWAWVHINHHLTQFGA